MTPAEVPRPDLERLLLERPAPVVVCGPPGAGKTTLLVQLGRRLRAQGWTAVYLDLMAAASSPDRFVTAALEALPAEPFAPRLGEAVAIRKLAAAGRAQGAAAVEALFRLWASLAQAGGRPVALLLDEATEIRSLSYFSGLRLVHEAFAQALAARAGSTILASSFPSLARRLLGFEQLALPGFSPAEAAAMLPPAANAEAACRASFGWPRYLRAIAEASLPGDDVAAVWSREMAPGGRLEGACRHTYEALLLRSRGYGISKAVLAAVAHEEGLNLTALVARLGRTPGAVRDYLHWLVDVDALRMRGKRYVYVDGLLRWWVRLYGRGGLPDAAELARAAQAALEARDEDQAAPVPEPGPAGAAEQPEPVAATRRDSLMEID